MRRKLWVRERDRQRPIKKRTSTNCIEIQSDKQMLQRDFVMRRLRVDIFDRYCSVSDVFHFLFVVVLFVCAGIGGIVNRFPKKALGTQCKVKVNVI